MWAGRRAIGRRVAEDSDDAADELDELRSARNLGQPMEVIAERTLEFMESGATQPHTIRITLGKPIRVVLGESDQPVPSEPRPLAPGEPEPEDRCCWGAPFAIHGPVGAVSERCMFGEDSLQALMLAIRIIPTFLEVNFASRGTLTCDGAPWDLRLGVQFNEREA